MQELWDTTNDWIAVLVVSVGFEKVIGEEKKTAYVTPKISKKPNAPKRRWLTSMAEGKIGSI